VFSRAPAEQETDSDFATLLNHHSTRALLVRDDSRRLEPSS
jgi:hypothetical protein